MRRYPVPRRWASALLVGALAVLPAGCTSDEAGPAAPPASASLRRPPARSTGERLPAFSGGDPAARGWAKVDGLLWIEASDLEAWRRGLVFDGERLVPRATAGPRAGPALEGWLLRTDHVALRTDLAWARAVEVAREAEAHLARLLGVWGEALDLRLPDGPVTVVAMRSRAEFEAALAGAVAARADWGAWYDARSGAVTVCLEPAPGAELPWRADLRHEMTHQQLDLSAARGARRVPFAPPWFWLWEGLALWTEELGPSSGALAARWERCRRRLAWGDGPSPARLLALDADAFEGRDYDGTAVLMARLLGSGREPGGAAVLATARALLRGEAVAPPGAATLGVAVEELERGWRAWVER